MLGMKFAINCYTYLHVVFECEFLITLPFPFTLDHRSDHSFKIKDSSEKMKRFE